MALKQEMGGFGSQITLMYSFGGYGESSAAVRPIVYLNSNVTEDKLVITKVPRQTKEWKEILPKDYGNMIEGEIGIIK